MSEFNLLAATRTLEKSMAYVLHRFLLSFGVGLGYLFAALAGAGTLVGFAFLAKNAGAVGPFGATLGFGAFGYLMYKLRGSWLHAVKAPHLALLAAQAKGEPLPTGKALVDFAKQQLVQKFPGSSGLFELDSHIRSTLAGIAESASASLIPSANPRIRKYLIQAIGWLYSQNHQSVLAWLFYSGAKEAGPAAETALAAQKQHYGTLLKYRIYASLFEITGFAAAFPLLSIGFDKLVAGIPIAFGWWPWIFGGVFAWTLKAAFFEPIAEAAVMDGFFPLIAESSSGTRDEPADVPSEEPTAGHSDTAGDS